MTREHKIALILGFAVILVVGVLISDHLSQAHVMQVDETASADTLRREAPAGEAPSRGLLASSISGQGNSSGAGAHIERRDPPQWTATPAQPVAQNQPAPSYQVPTPQPQRMASAQPQANHAPVTETPTVIQQGGSEPGLIANALEAMSERYGVRFDRVGTERTVPLTRTTTVDPRSTTQNAASQPTTPHGPANAVPDSPPAPTYVVRAEDNLWSIAERHLGSGTRWRQIRELNKDVLPDDNSLRVGMKLRLPAAARTAERSAPVETASAPAPKRPTTYTVKSGDSLSKIAEKMLGSSSRAGEIVKANAGLLDDPDRIRVGMELVIPAS